MSLRGTGFVVSRISDMARAAALHRDTLGLSQEASSDAQWAGFDCGSVTLSLKGGAALPEAAAAGRFALAVEDIQGAYAEMKTKAARIAGEPVDGGVCQAFEVLDPDGNTVILHRRADETSGQSVSPAR